MNSLQVLGPRLGNAKAAIQRPKYPSNHAAPLTKGSNAQIVTFTKSGDSEGATSHDGRVAKVVEN